MKGNQTRLGGQDEALLSSLPFVVTAAHELKSPLALVRQLALGLSADDLSPAERQRIIDQIKLTSERALRLTTNLTRSSRLEDSLFELEPLNPVTICEEVAHELTPLYEAHGRKIQVASRHRPLLVVANRDLLRRVILNFGDNALHYSEANTPVELQASAFDSGSRVRIGVRDFGPAVPASIWRRLEQQLGRSQQALHTRPQSSGLGLYVAGQFAQAMHGGIGAIRHRDGATFYIDIDASTQLSLL